MAAIEKRTYQAGTSPRISVTDDIQGSYTGFRASSVQSSGSTTTITVSNATLTKELGGMDALNGEGVIIVLTDLLVFAQATGSLLVVKSGADPIWQTLLSVGFFDLQILTPIVANKGEDLTVTITGAGTSCSIALSGRVLT